MLISIIINNYNYGRFLRRCIDLPGLPPEKWSVLMFRVSAILRFEGATNGTEDLCCGTDHRDDA